jgi:hypothetical protein
MPIVDHAMMEEKKVFIGVLSRQILNKKSGGSAAITVRELKIKPRRFFLCMSIRWKPPSP